MIMGSRAVTQSAMDAVAYIYTEMTKRFTPKYPKNKFDGYIIYMTNGEPWSELSNLAPIGTMMIDKNGVNIGDELRGGTSPNYLWISEQMICKKGVKTRNDAFAAGTRAERDDTERTFDQVIHEFGHAIDFKFGLRARILAVYNGGWDPVEQFPWSIQHWFGAPSGTLSTSENSFIGEIFSSKTTFPSDIYSMSSLLKVTIPSGEVIYASPVDNNPSVQWGTLTDLTALNNLPNFDAADKDFNGKTNTDAIVAQLGNNGAPYAAKVCADLNVNGFMGFKDWYLPASGELNELYKKLGPLANGGSGQITSGVYWSSSEKMNSHAWIRYFNNGNQDIFDKGNKTKCRCVRKGSPLDNLLKVTMTSGNVIYASPVDNNPSVQWGTLTDLTALNNLPNFDAADKDFNGKTNTDAIVAQLGNNGAPYAAKVCADLNVNGFMGFKDWYLPASGELNELYKKLGPLANGGSGQITSGVYWSSSEKMNSHAWIRYFNNGNQDIFDKGNKTKCRCVRK